MNDLEVLERWELLVVGQRTSHKELELPRVLQQTVAGVDSHLLADRTDHPAHLAFEVGRVVDDVKVRVADPSGRRVAVQLAS